jgi:hypothetical protein
MKGEDMRSAEACRMREGKFKGLHSTERTKGYNRKVGRRESGRRLK